MFERILIATDGSKYSEQAAEVGIEMARLYGSAVTALFVMDIGKEYGPLGDLISKVADDLVAGIKRNLKDQGETATKKVEEIAAKSGITVTRNIEEGYPAEDILRVAKEGNVNLIVMGGIGATGLEGFLLGSVADKVVRGSPIPVLVVRKQ
ncbi:MAG TPA: universal stress protein [Methanothrix sp.]|nr:universal stress protein [Methanothrix sp.]